MLIKYGLIAKDTVILSSHQIDSGNFEHVAQSMLGNIPTHRDTKTSYTGSGYMFHVMVERGIIYMASTEPNTDKRIPFAFLDEIRRKFESSTLIIRAGLAEPHEFDREFSNIIGQEMERCSRGKDKLTTLQSQVDEVKGIMTQNIEKVLERGERLEDLVDKSVDLEANSMSFRHNARGLHKKMWWQNMKMRLCLICLVIFLITVIVFIILFSLHILPPQSSSSSPTPKP